MAEILLAVSGLSPWRIRQKSQLRVLQMLTDSCSFLG
jgi:hypothetical protein